MGHDYHGIVITEAFLLCQEDPEVNALFQNASSNKTNIDSIRYEFYCEHFLNNIDKYKNQARKLLSEDKIAHQGGKLIEHYGLIHRPVDKRENYIKRCVGIPKDWIEIRESILYVNDKKAFVPKHQNLQYEVTGIFPDDDEMKEFGLEVERLDYEQDNTNSSKWIMNLTLDQLNKLKAKHKKATFKIKLSPQYSDSMASPSPSQRFENLLYFPKDPDINNTVSDFTKFQVPYKGQVIDFNKQDIAWYRRIISAYEGHDLKEKKDGIYIDGKKTNSYTIEMDYYWLMGDNRYNSADSRVWGFVPEDHVVGRASLVWFSKSPYMGIRWNRIFKRIK